MDYSAIRAAVDTWINAVLGLVPSTTSELRDIFWYNRPQGFHRDVYAICRLTAPTKIGQDGLDYIEAVDPDPGQEIIPVATGQRKITLTISVYSYVPRDDKDALHYTTLLEDSLSLPEHQVTLAAAGIGFEQSLGTTPLDRMVPLHDREMSAAQLALRFHGEARVQGTPTTYVAHYGIQSQITDPAGNLLPGQDNRIIPPL